MKPLNVVEYKTVQLDDYTMFYREGGNKDKPVLLFLHGFPSSSRMWEPLLRSLSKDYRVIAPGYIGFGHSSQPAVNQFAYTFDHLALYLEKFIDKLSLEKFTLIMQDYGAPIGFRIAEKHPGKIQSFIIQNAVYHSEGLSPLWETRKAFWADKGKYYNKIKENFISLEATRQRHIGNSPYLERIDPDTWTDEFLFLNKPGMAEIQLDLFYDYQHNVSSYQRWQHWLRANQPPILVTWGKYDPSFTVEETEKIKADVPGAEIHLLDGGHFVLDEQAPAVFKLMQQFLYTIYHPGNKQK